MVKNITDYDATKLNAGDVTPMIVHPAFKLGDKELTGIWVAKFEASGVNDLSKTDTTVVENWTNYVGNRSATSSTPVAVTDNTVLTIKPSVPSWRDITIGDAQTQSMKLTNSTSYGWTTNTVDSSLKIEYEKYWDKYEVGNDEKANAIKISDSEILTQNELWDINKYQLRYNEARKRITEETIEKMISHKGEAMYEIIAMENSSFYAPYLNGSTMFRDWFKVAYDQPNSSSLRAWTKGWNGDYALVGHVDIPIVIRGGTCYGDEYAGVSAFSFGSGVTQFNEGFRPVLAF